MTIVCVCYLEEVMVCFGSAKDLQIQIEVYWYAQSEVMVVTTF